MTTCTAELQHAVEQFYYREAALLDNREYQQWLALISEDISYTVPGRSNVLVDNRMSDQEAMISVERELEGLDSNGSPIRSESYIHLALRVERSYKKNAWSDNPPARTRRIVGNVQVQQQEGELLRVNSNFLLYYARPGSANFVYSGQRRDELLIQNDKHEIAYKIRARTIVMDMDVIDVPTLGLFF